MLPYKQQHTGTSVHARFIQASHPFIRAFVRIVPPIASPLLHLGYEWATHVSGHAFIASPLLHRSRS